MRPYHFNFTELFKLPAREGFYAHEKKGSRRSSDAHTLNWRDPLFSFPLPLNLEMNTRVWHRYSFVSRPY